jgi:hypothetical protein
MPGFKSLVAVAAITTLATMSIAQAAGHPGRKTVHQPRMIASETVRGSHAQLLDVAPVVSDFGSRGLSAPAGRS